MAPRRRLDKLSPEARQKILDAAADEFAREGFERASINQIAARAGLSKGALYYYFDDKEDLYGAVMDDVMDRVVVAVADLGPATDAASYWRLLREGLDRMNTFMFQDPRLAALGRSLYRRGEGDPTYQRLINRSRGWVRAIVEMGQKVGAVRRDLPVTLLAESLFGMLLAMDRWFVMAMDTVSMDELAALMPRTLELARDLLAPREARETKKEEEP